MNIIIYILNLKQNLQTAQSMAPRKLQPQTKPKFSSVIMAPQRFKKQIPKAFPLEKRICNCKSKFNCFFSKRVLRPSPIPKWLLKEYCAESINCDIILQHEIIDEAFSDIDLFFEDNNITTVHTSIEQNQLISYNRLQGDEEQQQQEQQQIINDTDFLLPLENSSSSEQLNQNQNNNVSNSCEVEFPNFEEIFTNENSATIGTTTSENSENDYIMDPNQFNTPTESLFPDFQELFGDLNETNESTFPSFEELFAEYKPTFIYKLD